MARVMIIDDEEIVRFTLRELLEAAGYEVLEAEDGAKGVELYATQPADVVITDVIMPNKEGIETILELKRNHPQLKIVAISGGGRMRNVDFLRVAARAGANEILAKPFENRDLIAAVERCLVNTAAVGAA